MSGSDHKGEAALRNSEERAVARDLETPRATATDDGTAGTDLDGRLTGRGTGSGEPIVDGITNEGVPGEIATNTGPGTMGGGPTSGGTEGIGNAPDDDTPFTSLGTAAEAGGRESRGVAEKL
jgi:hypothetical protein